MNSFCGFIDTFNAGSTSMAAAVRHEFSRNISREIDSANSASWWAAVDRLLAELVALEPGWDGYQGLPVRRENAAFAKSMIGNICGPDSPLPQIVPGASGDLQVEWHTLGGDLELHVSRPYRVSVWFEKSTENDSRELELTSDFKTISIWLNEITETELAAEPATA
jgi:hypothetical protein